MSRQLELMGEIQILRDKLTIKEQELREICDHKHHIVSMGVEVQCLPAWQEHREIRECSICGKKEWL